MAEIQNPEELTLHTKRKPDLNSEDIGEHPKKAQKLETSGDNSSAPCDRSEECEATPKSNNNSEAPNSNCPSVAEEKTEKVESDAVAKEDGNEGENEVDSDDEDDDGDEDDDDDDEDDEESNGKAEVDRKGKGILRDDKGKGKMIEEDDEDDDDSDDDDSSDDGGVSDGDSDLSDDPLAEVDLNNILPSRTRRRPTHPGVIVSNDLGNDEGDDSDDSDA